MSREIMRELGLRVGLLRRRKHLSQQELAARVAASPTTISNIEQGKMTGLHLDHLVGLAQVLETSPNDLLGWQGTDILHVEYPRKKPLTVSRKKE
jgi:transcriptional regulator with XRE-family HTH domain